MVRHCPPVFWVAILALCALAPAGAGQPNTSKVPLDRAVLELDVPRGTTITLAGKDHGTRTLFSYKDMPEDKPYRFRVDAAFPGGGKASVPLLIQGGWQVRVALRPKTEQHPELVLQTGHSGSATCAALSGDGRLTLTGGHDNTAILWDTRSGQQLRTFRGHVPRKYPEGESQGVTCVALSDDGRLALTGSWDMTAILWETATGRRLQTFKGHTETVKSVAFSADGWRVLTGAWDGTAALWDAKSGKRLQVFKGHTEVVHQAALSADGRRVITGSHDNTAIIWDGETGQRLHTLKGHTEDVGCVALSADGRQAFTGSSDRKVIIWDVPAGRQLHTFEGSGGMVISRDGRLALTTAAENAQVLWDVPGRRKLKTFQQGRAESDSFLALSGDGRYALLKSGARVATAWDTQTGRKVQDLTGHTDRVVPMTLWNDRQVLVGSEDHVATLWDLQAGQMRQRYVGHTDRVEAVAVSGDGRRVLTGSWDKTAILWDAETGQKLHTLKGPGYEENQRWVIAVALSNDGRRAMTATINSGQPTLWDGENGKQLHTFSGHLGVFQSHLGNGAQVVSSDGRQVLTISEHDTVTLWDATGNWQKIRTFQGGHRAELRSAAFSATGRHVFTTADNHTAVVWDAQTGQILRTFKASGQGVNGVQLRADGRSLTRMARGVVTLLGEQSGQELQTFTGSTLGLGSVRLSDDGRRLLTGSGDGIRLWDVATGQELCRFVSLDRGQDWVVVTPEGLFDGSLGGRQKVSYRVGGGLNIVPVDRFFQDFYYPGLLAALWRGERPLPGVKLGTHQPPTVRILAPKQGGAVEQASVTVEVEAEDKGGGIKGPWLLHNGARVLAPGQPRTEGKRLYRSYNVALVEGDNHLEVKAASEDGSWESEPARLALKYGRAQTKPQLHLVVVGINRYATGAMNLRFAAFDAKAVAELFTRRGQALYRQVHSHTLLDDQATRKSLRQTLQTVTKQAQPQDTVLLFLAGHGTMVGQRYYFIPHDFRRGGGSLEDDIRKQALPGDEIGEYLAAVPALKRVLVFDTCQSGGAIGLTKTARNPFAFRGAIERLSRTQGVFTIAASAASEEAQEVAELKHGVLTYALLAGLKGVGHGPLSERGIQTENPERVASVLEWFNFAAGQVPRLTQRYFGREQDVQTSSQGQSFPLLPLEEP